MVPYILNALILTTGSYLLIRLSAGFAIVVAAVRDKWRYGRRYDDDGRASGIGSRCPLEEGERGI